MASFSWDIATWAYIFPLNGLAWCYYSEHSSIVRRGSSVRIIPLREPFATSVCTTVVVSAHRSSSF